LRDEFETHYFTAEEFVREATDAFEQAIVVYEQQNEFSMCATLYFELGATLKVLCRYEEAGANFVKSYQYASRNPIKALASTTTVPQSIPRFSNQLMSTQLDALKQAIHCYIQTSIIDSNKLTLYRRL
jgi:tetratricopeptide (TPR) repeat protein